MLEAVQGSSFSNTVDTQNDSQSISSVSLGIVEHISRLSAYPAWPHPPVLVRLPHFVGFSLHSPPFVCLHSFTAFLIRPLRLPFRFCLLSSPFRFAFLVCHLGLLPSSAAWGHNPLNQQRPFFGSGAYRVRGGKLNDCTCQHVVWEKLIRLAS